MNYHNKSFTQIIAFWLKRFCSLQVLAIVVSIVVGYFTFKSYVENKPSNVSIQLPMFDMDTYEWDFMDANKVDCFWSIGTYDTPGVDINDPNMFGPRCMLLFPLIRNISNRTIKDLDLHIAIWHDGGEEFENYLHKTSESSLFNTYIDTSYYDVEYIDDDYCYLHYKEDQLLPNYRIAHPILTIAIPERDSLSITFNYSLTYDGCESLIEFQYIAKIYGEIDENLKHIKTEEFLRNIINNYDENKRCIVINGLHVYKDLEPLSKEDFENSLYDYFKD